MRQKKSVWKLIPIIAKNMVLIFWDWLKKMIFILKKWLEP